MSFTLKNLFKKWYYNYSSNTLMSEFIVMLVIALSVIPLFINITLVDYDTYSNKSSIPITAVFNKHKFKSDMLQYEVVNFREKVLEETSGFYSILSSENTDESVSAIQSHLEYTLNDTIGVLLINNNTGQWYSNRNWFLEYPYNQLSPKEALIKLSKDDDVILYDSSQISHYTSPRGYYNGAYTAPVNELEEIYFIRGNIYAGYINVIKLDFYLSIPFLIIFILLVAKHIYAMVNLTIVGYCRNYKEILIVRVIKGIKIFFENLIEILKYFFLNRTFLLILLFWILFIFLDMILVSNQAHFYYTYFNLSLLAILSVVALILNLITTVLENINNKNKLIKYLTQVEKKDLDVEINPNKLGSLSVLAEKINNLKTIYKDNVNSALKNERLKTELITNVSHDLKTPLTSIISYVDILKDESLSKDEVKDYISILDNKSTKLKKLVEDLFEMSKMSSGQIILSKSEIDMVQLIHQSLGEFSFLGEDKGLSFKVVGDSSALLYVDGARMSRVMDNLICNAIKYSLENSRIFIEIVSTQYEITVIVKNISKYELDFNELEILERFVRGDKSRASSIEGSGLGLAISYSIVELHGGTLKVKCDGDLFKVIITLPKTNIITSESNFES